MSSRASILASIHRSLATARHLPLAPTATLPPAPATPDQATLIDQFATELTKLSGACYIEATTNVSALILKLLRERQATTLLAWSAEHLPSQGLLDDLQKAGIVFQNADVPANEPERSQRLAEIEQVTVGLTGADAALADNGTLALFSGVGRPRLASLSVRTHLALFTPHQLYASWAAWWASEPSLAQRVGAVSNLTFITGPSRTADIEMTLTVGVHGPKEVIAIVVMD